MNPFQALGTDVKQAGDQAVENSKSVMAKKQMASDLVSQTAAMSAPIKTASPRITSDADKLNPGARYGSRGGEKRIDTSSMTKPLGSFKKGGKVKKTGVYKLHKNEQVLNAKQTAKMGKKGGMAAVLGGS